MCSHAQMILASARQPHGAGVATAAALASGFDINVHIYTLSSID
jgi:hypothetical protein